MKFSIPYLLSAILVLNGLANNSQPFISKNLLPAGEPKWVDAALVESVGDYTFNASSGSYAEITGGTLSFAAGDDGFENIDMPFPFIYDSLTYRKARISVNGWMEFGQNYTNPGYANDLANPDARPLLAPFWDDLYADSSSEIRYQTLGTSPNRVFVVQWKNVHWSGAAGTLQNFQVRIDENSKVVRFVYGSMNNSTGVSTSIGINDAMTGSGHFLSVTPGNPPTTSSTTTNNDIANVNNLPIGTTYTFTPSCFNLWIGTVDSSWMNVANWNCGIVPGSNSPATIQSATPHAPILTEDQPIGILGIDPGASLVLNGGNLTAKALQIDGTLTVSSAETITLTGNTGAWNRSLDTGVFNPGSGTVFISGSGVLTLALNEIFNNLTIQSGKSFDPGQYSLGVNGSFTNEGTFWPGQNPINGNVFFGPVINNGTWKASDGSMTFHNTFTNHSGATFYSSLNPGQGTTFIGNAVNQGTFNAANSGKLAFQADWINDGTFTPGSGTVFLAGIGVQKLQAASGTNQFYNLTIQTDSRGVSQNLLRINHNLVIETGGSLDLGNHPMTVEGGISNHGSIMETRNILSGVTTEFLHIQNAAGSLDIYRGVSITPNGNMGDTTVEIRGLQTDGCTNNPTDQLIWRCFSITPQIVNHATIRYYYFQEENNGQIHNQLNLWRYLPPWIQEGTNYSYSPTCLVGQKDCWFQADEVDSFSTFGLGSGLDPTIVQDLDFSVMQIGQIQTKWVMLCFFLLGFMVSGYTVIRKTRNQ